MVGLEAEVGEVQDLVGSIEVGSSLVLVGFELPALVEPGPEPGALEAEEPCGGFVVVEDDLEAGSPVDAALDLGDE